MKSFIAERQYTFEFEGISIHASNIVFDKLHSTIPTHAHGADCYEIHYISDGFGSLLADGTKYTITPGTLYITGPYVEHSQTPLPENPMQEYCVYFQFSKSSGISAKTPLLQAFTARTFWFGQDHQNILYLMRSLFDELNYKSTGYQQQIKLLLSQILIHIVRNYEQKSRTSEVLPEQISYESKTLLIERAFLYEYQTLTLYNLAQKLSLSPRQTQRLLIEYYGKTFQQKRTDAKMSAAAILLQDKENSITKISDMLGYSSPEYFSSAFKTYYKVSPREYRKSLSL